MMLLRKFTLCAAGLLIAGSIQAATVELTMSSDKDPLTLTSGEDITFTVGITPESIITGYTLDIRYDRTELSFVEATQLVPFDFGGVVVSPGFNLDPTVTPGDPGSTGLEGSGSGRASVLTTNESQEVGDLFSLKFTVLDLVNDDLADLEVGILNAAADDINPSIGGEPFDISPNVVSTPVSAIPLPAALPLMASALFGLGLFSKRKRNNRAG